MKTTIDQLFDIQYGQKEYHNKEWLDGTEGKNILISSKGEDGGVYGFFDIPTKFKAPFITVQGYGTIGHAFVQEYDCAVDDHMLILMPKKEMTLSELYQTAYQIRRTKWRYRYGRGITPDRLKEQEIIFSDSVKNVEKFEAGLTPLPHKLENLPGSHKIKMFKLSDFFDVKRGDGSYLEKMDEGSTPVVSTKIADSGVCGFFDIEPTFKAPAITVGRIMCNPSIQMKDFATVPDDMFVLIPKQRVELPFLFYISAIIKKEGWRFNYSRKVTGDKLKELDVPMPVRESDDLPNLSYINLISDNSYGFDTIAKLSF